MNWEVNWPEAVRPRDLVGEIVGCYEHPLDTKEACTLLIDLFETGTASTPIRIVSNARVCEIYIPLSGMFTFKAHIACIRCCPGQGLSLGVANNMRIAQFLGFHAR